MADFQSILAKISTAGQAIEAAVPAIQSFSQDHIAGTQNLLLIAGAGVAAETGDSVVQAEASSAAQIAAAFVPFVFKLFSLFGHKKTPTISAPATAPAGS